MKYYIGPWLWVNDLLGGCWKPPAGSYGLDFRPLSSQGKHNTVESVGVFAVPDDVTLSGYDLLGQGDWSDINVTAQARNAMRALIAPGIGGNKLHECLWDALTLKADPTGQSGVRPLMPGSRLQYEMHFAGSKFGRTFDLNSPEGANVRAVIQEDYRAIRERARNGQIRNAQGQPDPEFHRRYLDAMGEKFKLNNPEDAFTPPGLPKETRLKHQTTITDAFPGADTSTFAGDLTWTEVTGNWDREATRAVQRTGTYVLDLARAEHDLSSDDHYTQATFVTFANDCGLRVAARFAAAAQTYYVGTAYTNLVALGNAGNVRTIRKYVTGTPTDLSTQAGALAASVPYKLTVNGSSLEFFQNGVSVATATDSAITGNTRTGINGQSSAGGGVLDDFEAADLAAGGGFQPAWAVNSNVMLGVM